MSINDSYKKYTNDSSVTSNIKRLDNLPHLGYRKSLGMPAKVLRDEVGESVEKRLETLGCYYIAAQAFYFSMVHSDKVLRPTLIFVSRLPA